MKHKDNCLYCGSKNIKTYRKIGSHIVYRCKNCSLVFTQKAGLGANVVNKEWYSDQYIASYLARRSELKKRFVTKVHEIESIQRGGKLLDVGCGVGLFLESMSENCRYKWELYGIDVNEKVIEIAKSLLNEKNVTFFLGKISSLNIGRKLFNCVTCFDVLEHDSEIKTTIRKIKTVLKPSGLLIIQCPNYASLMAFLCGENWDWWAVPDHVIHFNPSSLSSIIQSQGLRVRSLYTWDPQREFIANIQGSIKNKLNFSPHFGWFASKVLFLPLLLLWFLFAILEKKFHFGSLIVLVAEA